MHARALPSLVAWTLCILVWFLFNLVIAGIYKNNSIYAVKDGFTHQFGPDALWWLTLIIVFVAWGVWEIGISVSRKAWWGMSDTEIFQVLEKDEGVRRRFAAAARDEAGVTQIGLAGGELGIADADVDVDAEADGDEPDREREVRELLSRPRVMSLVSEQPNIDGVSSLHHRHVSSGMASPVGDGPRSSMDVDQMLSRRFGEVKGGHEL